MAVDDERALRDIISAKEEPNRGRLLPHIDWLLGRYSHYRSLDRDLTTLERITWVANTLLGDALIHCYEGRTAARENHLLQVRSHWPHQTPDCPFCFISEIDAVDHYAPKSIFPEYSVFSINLVPICSKCNRLKGDVWIEKSLREVYHPFLDKVSNSQFIFCLIDFSTQSPTIEYSVRVHAAENPAQVGLIENHVNRLDLTRRYAQQATATLSSIIESFRQYGQSITIEAVRRDLERDAAKAKSRRGVNSWEYAMNAAMIDSVEDFVNYLNSLPPWPVSR